MKKHSLSVLMLLICIVLVKPRANAEEVRVAVPYDFVVAGKLLHAGTYSVSRESPDRPFGALRLTNVDQGGTAMFILPTTFESQASDDPKLRFEQTGDLHVLSAIQTRVGVYTLMPEPSAVTVALRTPGGLSTGN